MRTLPMLLAAAILAAPAGAQSFSETVAWSEQMLAQARTEVAAQRQALIDARAPKVEELTRRQAAVQALRGERDTLTTRTAGARQAAERAAAAARADEQTLASTFNRLQRVRSVFEEKMHIVERPDFRAQLLALEQSAAGAAVPELAAMEIQFDLAMAALERLGRQLGGRQTHGTVFSGGLSASGTVLQAGPYAWFFPEQAGAPAGLVREGPGLQPMLAYYDRTDGEALRAIAAGGAGVVPLDPTLKQAFILAEARVGLWAHIVSGGLWMIPIFAFGLVSLGVAVLKLMQLRGLEAPTAPQVDALAAVARAGGSRDEFDSRLGPVTPALRPVFAEGYTYRSAEESVREAAMHQEFIAFRSRLERRLSLISLTAAIAPLLGLLGTVTGMIKTFQLISLYGTGDAKAFSAGISEALVTTEYGLIVAIPALLLHALLSRRTRRLALQTAALIDTFNKSLPAASA